MNYTTNYHLPQWVETDRIQMEDFNQAMADIDEAMGTYYGTENNPWTWGSFPIVPGNIELGSPLVTFDFAPSLAIIAIGSVALLLPGTTTEVLTDITVTNLSSFSLKVQLSGDKLLMLERGGNTISNNTLRYLLRR